MYLKSLVLKGFKSFADRSVLTLEPGITAVVGPNGSGKSNISDAVLWVLGERSARNLRGQAMEDVIFAGSTARKPTGVAEVELVLDNADGTLPVEYAEVSVARRMYRTGESEYLINGTVARRMDVLDILHDTGLGTGTHSIISQGSLDSILRSGPEERRALIEEAAGVLKHKQRKERSARKLERMGQHVMRVRDVVAEVERQLGPLARKARKAQTYAEVSERLAEANLALAVDDLRRLRREWDGLKHEQEGLVEQADARRRAVDEAERALEELQEQMRTVSIDVGGLQVRYRRIASSCDRFDSVSMRIRDRRRAALERVDELDLRVLGASEKRQAIASELEASRRMLSEAEAASGAVAQRIGSLEADLAAKQASCDEAQKAVSALARDAADAERRLEEMRVRHAGMREAEANRQARLKLMQEQAETISLSVEQARAQASESSDAADAAERALDALATQEAEARSLVAACVHAREAARSALDEANAAEHSIAAQIDALEAVDAQGLSSVSRAREWMVAHADALPGALEQVARAVKPKPGSEALVEALLGDDVLSLLVDDLPSAEGAVSQMAAAGAEGRVALVARRDPKGVVADARTHAARLGGRALIDDIDVAPEAARAVFALIGDVVVCPTLADAVSAHGRDEGGLRFATPGGDVVWPSGKISVGAHAKDDGKGVLARARRLRDLKAGLESARTVTAQAKREAAQAEEALASAQDSSLALTQKLAALRGDAQSSRHAAQEAARRLEHAEGEAAKVRQEIERLDGPSADGAADADALACEMEGVRAHLEEVRAEHARRRADLEPAVQETAACTAQLNEAKLEAAKLQERCAYLRSTLSRHADDLDGLARDERESRELMAKKHAAAARLEPLLSLFEELAQAAQKRARALRAEASDAQTASDGLNARMTAAREAARDAHAALDEVTAKVGECRIQNARFEMQVQSAVNAIVDDQGVPLEQALALPEMDDREAVADEAFRLSRRIANLGSINMDAADEYAALKERFDYLSAQLDDLDAARRALARIDRAIEDRMKSDFARTFDEVNANFQEIFATLFPGGAAHLTLIDPDDMETSGVEVNAQPAGKRITKMMLMSGGEKSLTALALLFAVYRTRSTPFYILDEVEAALDDSNLRRLVAFIDALRTSTQLIMITHQRRTMEMADVLFGVSMQADGVTKVVSQKLERALEYAE